MIQCPFIILRRKHDTSWVAFNIYGQLIYCTNRTYRTLKKEIKNIFGGVGQEPVSKAISCLAISHP